MIRRRDTERRFCAHHVLRVSGAPCSARVSHLCPEGPPYALRLARIQAALGPVPPLSRTFTVGEEGLEPPRSFEHRNLNPGQRLASVVPLPAHTHKVAGQGTWGDLPRLAATHRRCPRFRVLAVSGVSNPCPSTRTARRRPWRLEHRRQELVDGLPDSSSSR